MVMAEIYTNCGRYEEAIAELDYVLSLETGVTVHALEFAQWTAPLFEEPSFQAILEKYR